MAAKQSAESKQPVCFVIMPISDVEGYPDGHFRRVYDHLIVPACEKAGFAAQLASDVKETNMIVVDILQRLHSAEMVICDLSARNPNVLFELGFRQAFNKPVTLIKDQRTERIFDIAGLRDIPYDEALRVDTTQRAVSEIAARLRATADAAAAGTGVNSLVQLINVDEAVIPERSQLSGETQIVLDAVRELSDRVRALEPVPVRTSKARALRPVRRYQLFVDGALDATQKLAARLQANPEFSRVEHNVGEGHMLITAWVSADAEREEVEISASQIAAEIGEIREMEHRWSSGLKALMP